MDTLRDKHQSRRSCGRAARRRGKSGHELFDAAFAGRQVFTGHTGFKGGWLSLWLGAGRRVSGFALPRRKARRWSPLGSDGSRRSARDIRDAELCGSSAGPARDRAASCCAASGATLLFDPADLFDQRHGPGKPVEAVRMPRGPGCVNVTTDKCYEHREWLGLSENEPMGGHDPYSNSKGCAELVPAYRNAFSPADGTVRWRRPAPAM